MDNIIFLAIATISLTLVMAIFILMWKITLLLKSILKAIDQQKAIISSEIKGLTDRIESRLQTRSHQEKYSSDKYLSAQDKEWRNKS